MPSDRENAGAPTAEVVPVTRGMLSELAAPAHGPRSTLRARREIDIDGMEQGARLLVAGARCGRAALGKELWNLLRHEQVTGRATRVGDAGEHVHALESEAHRDGGIGRPRVVSDGEKERARAVEALCLEVLARQGESTGRPRAFGQGATLTKAGVGVGVGVGGHRLVRSILVVDQRFGKAGRRARGGRGSTLVGGARRGCRRTCCGGRGDQGRHPRRRCRRRSGCDHRACVQPARTQGRPDRQKESSHGAWDRPSQDWLG